MKRSNETAPKVIVELLNDVSSIALKWEFVCFGRCFLFCKAALFAMLVNSTTLFIVFI